MNLVTKLAPLHHGLMIVGESFGAKTCMYKVLQGALTDMVRRCRLTSG